MRIEGGDGDVDDFHFADGAVAAAGVDEDGAHGADGDALAIEFHFAGAFEDEIDFGEFLVVVGFGVFADVDEVDGCGAIGGLGEGAAGGAAGAGDGIDVVEMGDPEAFGCGGFHGFEDGGMGMGLN